MNTDDGKRENKLLLLFFSAILKILPGIKSLINKDGNVNEAGNVNQDGNVNENVAENSGLNYRIQSLHVGMQPLAHRSPENKRNVGICWAKFWTGFKLNATYTNIMQHSPTWCTNERNMLRLVCTGLEGSIQKLTDSLDPVVQRVRITLFSG